MQIRLIKFFNFSKSFFVINTQLTTANPEIRNNGSIKCFSGMKKFKIKAKLPIMNREIKG